MLYHKEISETYHVMCSCGQIYPIVKPDLIEQLTCGVCGKIIKINQENLLEPNESNTAIYRKLKNHPPMERIVEGVRLIKEGKWELALPLFQSVVIENKPVREAFYGLGYCYYREKEYLDSLAFLGVAMYLGHPHAQALYEKVKQILKIDESNIPTKLEE
ncbi:MAG TPA: hypothetical protein PLA12_00740 [Candidatus Hydrogenedens sp.]|nr:hypothetical protein [Candidatus Hydrogenedens sp.]